MEIVVDGKRVFAATGGRPFEPARPSIVFVHGAGMDHTVWALQTRYFAYRGRSVLAVDLPGHGRSEGPPLPAVGEIADWLMRLLDAVEIDKAAIVGHSMGSLVALEAAVRHGARVSAVALLATSVPMPVTPLLLAASQADNHSAFDMVNVWSHSRVAQIGGNRAPGLWMTGEGLRLLERGQPRVLYADLKACDGFALAMTAAGGITCPVLLVLGEHDAMTPPRGAVELGAAIPGAKTVMLEGCGHMMMAEQPDQVLDALITIV